MFRNSLKIPRAALMLLVGQLTGLPALAEEDLTSVPFEALVQRPVVTASRLARQVSDAPSAVAIVTADDIRTFGYRTLGDVINSMRGLYTTSDRKYEYMGGRGFGKPDDFAGRVMLMIDGLPTQDNVFSQAYIDNSGFLDMALIERVEYVPGTGSVTYGNNAMLGIINVVTRKGADIGGTQLGLEAGSFGEHRERLTFGKQFDNGADVLLSASWLHSQGQNLYFPEYGQSAQGMDGEKNQRFFARVSQSGWTLEAAHVDRSKDVPTAPRDNTALNQPYRAQDINSYLMAVYESDLGLSLKSSTRLYAGEYRNRDFFEYATAYADGTKYRQNDSQGEWAGIDQKFVANWFAGHTLVLGAEYRSDVRQDYVKGYLASDLTVLPADSYRSSRNTASLYVEDAVLLNAAWQLVLGARHDVATDGFANTSPRLAAIFTPNDRRTIKASYSEAFRLPNAYDKFNADNLAISASPEYVKASELVLQEQLDAHTRLTGTVYHYDLSGVVFKDGASWTNTGHVRTDGLEAEAERHWQSGIHLRGSLAFQRARDADGGQLANSPTVLGKTNLSLPLPDTGLRLGVEGQYLGPRQTLHTQTWLPGVPLFNLTVSNEQKWHGFLWSASVRNVFDRRYDVAVNFQQAPDGTWRETLPMDGTTFWLQASYDF